MGILECSKFTVLSPHLYTHEHLHILLLLMFSLSVMSDSLWPDGLQHSRLPCPSPPPRACSDSCPLSRWCHPTILSLSSPSPVFSLSQYQGLFQWVSSWHQVAKVLELQLQHQSFQWIFRTEYVCTYTGIVCLFFFINRDIWSLIPLISITK